MPIYGYQCKKCNREWEAFRRIMERLEERCPDCHKRPQLLLSANVQVFKPFWHPHLQHEPVYIETKKQLKKELEERGLRELG